MGDAGIVGIATKCVLLAVGTSKDVVAQYIERLDRHQPRQTQMRIVMDQIFGRHAVGWLDAYKRTFVVTCSPD
jgi:hypothetical protein